VRASGTNCCLVLTPLVFSVVLGGARVAAAAAPRGGSTKVPHARTPLTPSSHLPARCPRAVVSFVINNILLSGAEYQCGCLCKEYTAPDGYVFAFANVRPFARERCTARGACS
jgi:hypothetical protein